MAKTTNDTHLIGAVSNVQQSALPSGDTIYEFTVTTFTDTDKPMYHKVKYTTAKPIELKEGSKLEVEGEIIYETHSGHVKTVIRASAIYLAD